MLHTFILIAAAASATVAATFIIGRNPIFNFNFTAK